MTKKSEQKQIFLFYSYSHKDEVHRNALAAHLSGLKRLGLVEEWFDGKINPGEAWADEIFDHLNAADIILLLVSRDFIASDYCWSKEMNWALEKHKAGKARVIPVIVRDVNWTDAPFGKLQALPKGGKAVTLWSNRDKAWKNVADGIEKVVKDLIAGNVIETPLTHPHMEQTVRDAPKQVLQQRLAERVGGQLKRTIYDAKNSWDLPGQAVRKEGDAATGDQAVDEAYDALGHAYNFFWDVFGRDSIDGKGMPLDAIVHYGIDYDNAFWNGKQIILGDGDGQLFNRFTIAFDVIAKEFTNGIIQEDTHLVYWGQSGALFNSIGVIFAVLVKQYTLRQTAIQADWLLGTGLMASTVNARALQSLANPGTAYEDKVIGRDPQPSHMNDYVNTKSDNGGVHINCGIPNHAFYRIATALGGYAWEKAGRIWYETMRDRHLKPKAKIKDFAQLTYEKSCRLYGNESDEVQTVKRGWDSVGIQVSAKADSHSH